MELAPTIPPEKSPATGIEVRMDDGTVYSAETAFPRGDIYRTPLTRDEIRAKYRADVAYGGAVSTQNAEKVLGMVESLEDIDDVRQITSLLV